jgi:hypothetical protein
MQVVLNTELNFLFGTQWCEVLFVLSFRAIASEIRIIQTRPPTAIFTRDANNFI